MEKVIINGKDLDINSIYHVAYNNAKVELCSESLKKVEASREYIFKIVKSEVPTYGINTGFGALSNKFIDKEDLAQLQINLIRSHCTGVGRYFDRETTRAIMLLRANCLSSGFSGVNPNAIQLLLDFLNHNVTPLVPRKGSVGASGDLAPLSHIALTLIGEGKVIVDGTVMEASSALEKIGKKPLQLGPKDGLALINGTAVMTAMASLAIYESQKLMKMADIISCTTLDGIKGSSKPFNKLISTLKPHEGQIACANNVNLLLEGSEILVSHDDCGKVQDPYSLRCIPQVHGACRQTVRHAKEVCDTEINAVTDNPLVFLDEQVVVSGGNFHGQAIAFAMDYLAMGISEIGNMSERRIEKMMNPTFSDLPAFLVENSGLNSGLMIAHVTAAALASENKGLCHPASTDSIPTSTDKEDHVSMGVTAGRKLLEVTKNVQTILAIELLCATQAFEFQRPLKSSPAIEAVYDLVRKLVPPIKEDRVFHDDILNVQNLIKKGKVLKVVEDIIGELQ